LIRTLAPENAEGSDWLELQKEAIIGHAGAVSRLMAVIRKVLDEESLSASFSWPAWYVSEEDAIYQEVWGRAGLAEWWRPPYDESGSAKIIGDNIFFQHQGKMRLMPQLIGEHRREQLLRGFLLLTPGERLDRDFHEIYLADGVRLTVYKNAMTKKGQDVFIFRRYIIPEYSFAEQARRGTIPAEAGTLFEAMVAVGYNVVFCGPVRSAKTTFLSTWQKHEDPLLEGVMIETDPEVPLHALMPGAPIVQLLADGEALSRISKNLLRSDADYFIFAEARDGIALDAAFRMARKGRGRMKMTFHTNDPYRFAEDAALEVVRRCGGDMRDAELRAASSFDYIFHMSPAGNEDRKVLQGIYELGVRKGRIYYEEICAFAAATGNWRWSSGISQEKIKMGMAASPEAFGIFYKELVRLANN
jgi:pilus assembly protein CpaF